MPEPIRTSSTREDDTDGTVRLRKRARSQAGLAEHRLDTGLRVQIIEQFGHQHAILALGIVGDLARRGGRKDQRVVRRIDRRQAVGERAKAALIGIAPRGVDDDELGVSATFLHRGQDGFDADALAPNIGFLPDRRIDRDHIAFATGLDAVAAEEQHHHRLGLDLRLQTIDRTADVVLAGVFDDVDVETVATQGTGQRARVIDGLGQRRIGVGVVTIANHQGNSRSGFHRLDIHVGRGRLHDVGGTLVQCGMGAKRQRDQSRQSGGDRDRAAGYS